MIEMYIDIDDELTEINAPMAAHHLIKVTCFPFLMMSIAIGRPIAPEKGHPTSAEPPAARMTILRWPWSQAPIIIAIMYIENEDGRKAVEEMNIPVPIRLKSSMNRAIIGPNVRFTPR